MFLLPFEAVDRLNVPGAPRLVHPSRWRHVARRVLADATPSWASLCAAARADLTLIPFQLEPALALARGDGCRFLIADAVGLGKTVQGGLMVAELLQRQPDARALVISPAALRDQWGDELRSRFRVDAEVLDAAGVARLTARLPAGVNPWSVQSVVITSIDYIKRPEVMRSLEPLIWDLAVFDEAHHLAGRSDRASAAGAIGNRSRALVLLTATPHSGDDEAFGRLCNVGNVKHAYPLLVFRRTRTDVGIATSRRTSLLRVRPAPAEAAMHAALTAYARLARVAAGAESKLAILHRLISRTTEPAIIFTEYRDTLRRIAAALEEVDAVQLHGGLTSRERADAVRRFTEGGARLLLATDAASEGLNLHHRCRLVINLELPWTPLRLDQRAGRVDRIGQVRTVHAIHLVAAGTCEESTLARLARRINRMRDAIGFWGPLPDERRVAESALGNQPLPTIDATRPAALNRIVPADFRSKACAEAERLARARQWLDASGDSHVESRAVVARLRSRNGTVVRRQCFWAFRLTVTNAKGQVVWESLVPVAASLAGTPGPGRADIRSVLNTHHPVLERVIGRAHVERVRELRDTFRQPLHLWIRRERNLIATMRESYARLSAGLVQGALFDRRHERLAAAQVALLDEALSRSALRLEELAASQDVRADAPDLVFGVVVG